MTAAFVLLATGTAFAQFANSTAKTTTSSSTSSVSTDGWSAIFVEYNPVSYNIDISGLDDESLSGFSAGYLQAFPISSGTPLFIETGLGVQYTFKNDFSDNDDLNFNMFSLKAPVSLAYAFHLNNSQVSIIPFAGATLRFNISGKFTYDNGKKDYDWDVFDKNDMDDMDLLDGKAWNRFQLGWQIGVKARIGDSFLIGASYGKDFSEIAKKVTVSTTAITLGYTF